VQFALGSQLAHLGFESVGPMPPFGKRFNGFFHIDSTGKELPPSSELAMDPSSNQTVLGRSLSQNIGVHVYMSEMVLPPGGSGIPPALSDAGVPTPTADAGSKRPPRVHSDEGYNRLSFVPGVITLYHRTFALPQNHPGDFDVWVEVPYVLSRLLAGVETINLELFYRIFINPADTIPTSWNSLTIALMPAQNPTTTTTVRLAVFKLPKAVVNAVGAGGGQLSVWLARRSDDIAVLTDFVLVGDLKAFDRPSGQTGVAFTPAMASVT